MQRRVDVHRRWLEGRGKAAGREAPQEAMQPPVGGGYPTGSRVLNYAKTMPVVPKLCPFKLKMFT
jgi:hypothetical protein